MHIEDLACFYLKLYGTLCLTRWEGGIRSQTLAYTLDGGRVENRHWEYTRLYTVLTNNLFEKQSIKPEEMCNFRNMRLIWKEYVSFLNK